MILRFFIFLLSIMASFNAIALNADDVKLTVEPFSKNAMSENISVNNFMLKLNLPDGWYTYYKNGGDAAKGPILTFNNLPKNIKQTELFFATPHKKIEQGFASYYYKNDAILGFNLLRTDDYKQALNLKELNLNGKLEFLVCKHICLPITKEFSFNQPVSNGFTPNIVFFKLAEQFPAKKDIIFNIHKNNLFIKLNNATSTATFIPNEDGFINDSDEQKIVLINNNKFLKITLDEFLKQNPTSFTGVLKTNIENYNITATKTKINILTTQQQALQLAIIALFAIVGGIILNLMPCVLPVIGLKVFALLKHKTVKERLKGALSYSIGVFTCMMIIVAILITLKALGNELAWGFQLQNKYFIGFMIALLTLIGLNLLGIFEFGGSISNKANKLNMKYSNDFFTGVLTTLVATPCSAPFMATSLGFALTNNSNIITFIVFAFLALGICLPILLVAALPKTHKLLPKPGAWSERLKQFLAFPIFATIIWLVWVLDSGNYIVTLCLSGIFLASFIGWNLTLKTKYKYLIIILTIALSILAIFNHTNKPEEALTFNKNTIEQLNKQGQNVFVNFTAKWCLTCQYNKKSVLDLTSTRKLFNKYNTKYMIADWTNKDSNITKELETFNRSGVPVYIIYPADGSSPILLPEILTQNIVKNYLERL